MFIIKNYDRGCMDYSAYECKHYRKEYAGKVAGPGYHVEAYTIVLNDETVVRVLGMAYVENSEGKTIDTIRAKDVDECSAMVAVK